MAENAARNFAQRNTAYTTDTIDKTKLTPQEATKAIEYSYAAAFKGIVLFNLKLIDIAQEHVNAAFDFVRELHQLQRPSAFLEVSAAHTSKQSEKLVAQAQHLTGLAQKTVIDTAQSLQTGVSSTFTEALSFPDPSRLTHE